MTAPIYVEPALASFATGLRRETLAKWVRRGHISAPVNGRYDLAEIQRWIETGRNPHRARIAESRYRCVVSHRESA